MKPRHTTKTSERLREEGAPLAGMKIAILVADGFEQEELVEPRNALKNAGAQPFIISPVKGKVRGWEHTEWGDTFPVDIPLDNANPDDFAGLLLPGGVMNPDKLRADPKATQFVRDFFAQGKPVAAICHGPWTLIDAGVVKGRQMTSYHSIKSDLINAGAKWVDEEVIVDNGLVTSRKPADIPAFNRKMIEEFAEGKHEGQKAGVAMPGSGVPLP
jgi:protease I